MDFAHYFAEIVRSYKKIKSYELNLLNFYLASFCTHIFKVKFKYGIRLMYLTKLSKISKQNETI